MRVTEPRKLSFSEAWNTTTEFFVDDTVEKEIDQEVTEMTSSIETLTAKSVSLDEFAKFTKENPASLDIALADITLSQEKFKRIVTLLRRKGMVSGGFDTEWSPKKIMKKIQEDTDFANQITSILYCGKDDPLLVKHLPKYYREKLNWRQIGPESAEKRILKLKESIYSKKYANIKGGKIEQIIGKQLEAIKKRHGMNYTKGRSRIVDVTVDWAIPSVDDPWVIIMVSYQETTSSGQSTKQRDMLNAYQNICRSNSRNQENRAFVNFIDGVGWLARKADFQRLVDECHYFINLKNLDLLESILLKHIPKRYRKE